MIQVTESLHPLPRTLVPLAEESLIGYILRLSHRLDETPLNLLQQTGMLGRQSFRGFDMSPTITDIPPMSRQNFRLVTKADSKAFTLDLYASHYPPVADDLERMRHRPRSHGGRSNWVNRRSSRCCPQCLAGDGSEIQRRHGGAWKIQWHLPVVFACLEHDCFLRDTCPCCQKPIQSASGTVLPRVVPSAAVSNLHPGQCRVSVGARKACGARLDCLDTFQSQQLPPLTTEAAALQRRILDLLDPEADPADSWETFTELIVLSALITSALPHHDLPVPRDLAPYLSQHIEEQESLIGQLDSKAAERSRDPRTAWTAAPRSAPATAALIGLAYHYRGLPTPVLREEVTRLLEHARHQDHPRWTAIWKRLDLCSARLSSELEGAFQQRFPPAPRWPSFAGCLITKRPSGFSAEHIPQEIPPDWFTPYFGQLFEVQSRKVRAVLRSSAMQLVQAVSGSTAGEAADYLGLPASWLTTGSWGVMRPDTLRRAATGEAIVRALHQLAAHVASLPRKIDYHERRLRFAGWDFTDDDWQRFTRDLHTYGGLSARLSNDLQRRSSSAFIWSRLTGSEWVLAPAIQQHPSRANTGIGSREGIYIQRMRNHGHSKVRLALAAERFADQLLEGPR